MGYYPTYGYYGVGYYDSSYGYFGVDYSSPVVYRSYTTVYRPEPYVESVDNQDVYYANNIYIGQEGEEMDVAGAGSVAILSTPSAAAVERTIEPTMEPTAVVTPPEPTVEGDGSDPVEATLVDFGNAAFNAGDYDEAIRYYVGAVLADDEDAIARLFYGLAQFAIGDYDLAALGMRRALTVMPDLIDRPIDLRSLYPDVEMFQSHLDELVRFVEEHPGNTNALLTLGYVYYASAHPDLAVPVLRTLVDMDPKDKLAAQVRNAAITVLSAGEDGA